VVRRAKNEADWPRTWPDVAHHELPHVGHPVGRQVRAEPLHQVGDDDRNRHLDDAVLAEQDLVENRLDEIGDGARAGAVDEHREQGGGQPAPVGPRVAEQPAELVHTRGPPRARPA
jgi:hypothetical protein